MREQSSTLIAVAIGLASMRVLAAPNERADAVDRAALVLRDDSRSRRIDASPHAPVARLLYQGSTRSWAKLALVVPIWGPPAREGLFVHLLPLIELNSNEDFGSAMPAQLWRGRLSVEGGWRWYRFLAGRVPAVFSLSVALMHESDHRTELDGYLPYGMLGVDVLYVDDLALRGQLTASPGRWILSGALIPRFHLLSCTRTDRDCNAAADGGQGFELMLLLMNNARLGVGFEAIGLCESAYRLAKAYAAERKSMGKTIDKLVRIVHSAECHLVGIAAVIGKSFESGYDVLMEKYHTRIEVLANIRRMDEGQPFEFED